MKRLLFSLLPLIILFLALETTQRARYFSRHYDPAWLLYGFVSAEAAEQVRVIKLEQTDLKTMIGRQLVHHDPDPRVRVQPVTKFVVCLGSSTTAGVFNDPLNKYPYLLNELLRRGTPAGSRVRYDVINLGLSGAASDSYEAAIALLLSTITPEVVILYTGYTDIFAKDVNTIYAAFSAGLGPYWAAGERYSLLLLTAKEKYIFWKQNQRNSYLQDASKYGQFEAQFRSNIGRATRTLKARGIKVVLIPEVLMARRFGGILGDYSDYATKYQHIPGILQEIATEEGAELLTLQDAFDNDDFKKHFEDPAHLTNLGNRVLSQLIFDRSKTLQRLVSEAGPEKPIKGEPNAGVDH